jgi:hypothetical protein
MVIGSTEVSAAAEKGAAPDALYAALTGATLCRVRCGSGVRQVGGCSCQVCEKLRGALV